MKKYCIVVLLIVGFSFAQHMVTAADLYGGWTWRHTSVEGFTDDSHYGFAGIGIIVPFCSFAGVQASIFDIYFGSGTTQLQLAGRIGLIEKIPTRYASPYFRQFIGLDYIGQGGLDATSFAMGATIGIEFISYAYVSPIIEGTFMYAYESIDGFSGSQIGLGALAGIRVHFGGGG